MTQSDTALREACILAEELYWKDFFTKTDIKTCKASPSLDERIMNLIYGKADNTENSVSLRGKKKKAGKKHIIAIIAAVLVILVSTFAAASAPIRNYILNVYDDYSEFIFNSFKGNEDDYLYAEYSYIPEGYSLASNVKTEMGQSITYKNKNNQLLIQSHINSGSHRIDTENAETGEMEVGNYGGYYSITESSIILVWSTGKYNHIIIADLNVDIITLDEVVKIAESSVPAKK
ncbi:MAG: DUF4367 domain-containing protein [Clostridia bacterium]|nr:DUF4367 domain-containing protein [Clostridia bacterium]